MGTDRIIRAVSGFYYVRTETGIVECRARGRFHKDGVTPLVGDFVRVTHQAGKGVVEEVLPRKNSLVRPAIANIDALVLFASCAIPVTEPFLLDRLLVVCERQQIPAVICVNKADLSDPEPLVQIYRRAGYRTIVTSAETGEGVAELRELLEGKLCCLTGNSGVGKSSILNRLCPDLALPVGEVSEKLGRGRHTTRHVELYDLGDGTYLADTPGFSSFDVETVQTIAKQDLADCFPEFRPYLGRCQFPDCAHRREPGCAVRAALDSGAIGRTRYESYERLYELASQIKAWQIRE